MKENLDYYLKLALKNLKNSKNKRKGVVAAALIDKNKVVYSTSEKIKKGTWIHAERNAIKYYIKKYGLPSKNAIMVVSLSPCLKKKTIGREGDSCSNLLLGKDKKYPKIKIKRVHIGIIDPTEGNKNTYKKMGFNLTISSNYKIKTTCKNLFGYFSKKNYEIIPPPIFVNKAISSIS